MDNETSSAALRLTEQLGPLPEPALKLTRHPWNCYSAAQMVAERFATAEAATAAERERIVKRGEEFAANMLRDGDKAPALRAFLLAVGAGA